MAVYAMRKKVLFFAFAFLAVLLLLTAFHFLFAPKALSLSVKVGEASYSYSLAADKTLTYENNGYTVVVEIKNGAARILSSTCPDGVCMAGGTISRTGETLLCNPAGILLKIEGKEAVFDGVAF